MPKGEKAKRPERTILPFAGITLIRFYGYISVPDLRNTPRNLFVPSTGSACIRFDGKNREFCNFLIPPSVLPQINFCMKRTICLFSLFIMLALGSQVVAQPKPVVINDANAAPREVGSFRSIEVSDAIDVYLVQADEEGLAVSASEEKYRDQIITRVDNGVLRISYGTKKVNINFNSDRKKLRVYVSFKNLERITANGSSDIRVKQVLKAERLNVQLSGASDFIGQVDVNELNFNQSGSSDAVVTGRAGSLAVGVSGSSDFVGLDLVVDKCIAHASGSSDVSITVEKELMIHASGSSDIVYKGAAVITKMNTSGSSSVSKKS